MVTREFKGNILMYKGICLMIFDYPSSFVVGHQAILFLHPTELAGGIIQLANLILESKNSNNIIAATTRTELG